MANKNSITFFENENKLFLKYKPEQGSDWVLPRLDADGEIVLRRTFSLEKSRYIEDQDKESEDEWSDFEGIFIFEIGSVQGEYFKIDAEILSVKFDLYISNGIELTFRMFVGERNISIFRRIDALTEEREIFVGGNALEAISETDFNDLIERFPTTREIDLYSRARIASILENYFDGLTKYEDRYKKNIKRRLSSSDNTTYQIYVDSEISKYEIMHQRLMDMLNSEYPFCEPQWQREIIEFFLLLHPKYISIFKEVPIKDVYSDKKRSLDFMLVDALGNVDVVEIKQPFEKCLVTSREYRNNHVPLKELSGTVMQVEKYIYNMMKGGISLENRLTKKYESSLPAGMSLRIANPKGILILGRDNKLSVAQKNDFEIIRRKYQNVVEIMTYDDLLLRLNRILDRLKSNGGKPVPTS